jgi:hypothetical protein
MIQLCPFRPQDTEGDEGTETQRYRQRDLDPQVPGVRNLILPSRYCLVFHVAVGPLGRSCNSRGLVEIPHEQKTHADRCDCYYVRPASIQSQSCFAEPRRRRCAGDLGREMQLSFSQSDVMERAGGLSNPRFWSFTPLTPTTSSSSFETLHSFGLLLLSTQGVAVVNNKMLARSALRNVPARVVARQNVRRTTTVAPLCLPHPPCHFVMPRPKRLLVLIIFCV